MPTVNPAKGGSIHEILGVPHFDSVPQSDVLKAAKLAAAVAAAPESAVDRNNVERMSAACQSEYRQHPAAVQAVAAFKEGMEQVALPGSRATTCILALYLAVFILIAPVASNLGLDTVCILSVLATDPESKILDEDTATGYRTPDAGKLDLKLFKLLSVVFSSVPAYASFVADHHEHIGMSGMNAMMGFLLHLYRRQPLHRRTDVLLGLCTNTATPFHAVRWGGGHIRTLVGQLKRSYQINRLLVVLFDDAVKGMLAITEPEVCMNVLQQQRTPFDMPFLRQGLTAAVGALNLVTFSAFILVLEQNMSDSFFPISGKTPELNIHNPDVVEPEVDRVDEGSPGKRQKTEPKESCPVCKDSNCAGKWTKAACKESRHAGNPSHWEDSGKYPPHVRAKIAQLKKSRGPQQQQQRKGVCNLFNTAKGCHFGDRCRYSHESRAPTASPSAARPTVSALTEDDSFARYQRFLAFDQQAQQAAAASEIQFDETGRNLMLHRCNFRIVVRDILVRAHHCNFSFVVRDVQVFSHRCNFRSVTRAIRLRALLPCGRQGNSMLAFLLAHRFHSAARAKPPATVTNTYSRGTGQCNKFPSFQHSVIRHAAPTHRAALNAFDTDMRALATLINNPLVSNALRRRVDSRPAGVNQNHRQHRNKTRTKNKIRTKTHPIITKFKTRSSQSQNSKPPTNFPKHTVLPDSWCSGPSTIPAFLNAIFNSNRDKLFSDADTIRYTQTPIPSGSRVTSKVFDESAKEISSRTRKMYRLPFLTRAHFEIVHAFLEAEQDKCPAVGANSEPAEVPSATREKSCRRDYTSGTKDDTSIQYPVDWTGPNLEVSSASGKDVEIPTSSKDDQGVDDSVQEQILASIYGLDTYRAQASVNGVDEPEKKRARTSATPSARTRATFVAQNDCGTNVHTSNNFDNFITYKSYPKPRAVSVANGHQVYALGEGRVCISLQAEKLQKYNFQQRGNDDRTSTDQKMYVVLERCLHIPEFKQNFLDETQIRKAPGIHVVGDSLSKRIVDTRRGLQYSVVEAGGQEYIHGHTLTKSQYDLVNAVPQVNSFTAAEQNPSKREKKLFNAR